MINETVHEIKEYRPTNHRRRFFHWIRLFARRGYRGGKKKKKKIKDRHDLRSFIRGTTLISPPFLSLLEISSMTISLSCQRIDRFDFSRVIFLEDELVRELTYFMEKVIIIGLLVPVSTKSCSGIIKLLSKVLHSLKNITSECWIRE